MSHFSIRILTVFSTLAACLFMAACESNEPKRRKAVPPSADVSGLPWNRPTSATDGAGRFGSMVPQSR